MNELLKDMQVGEALRGLKTHQGYKVLINEIIMPLYNDAFATLEDHDDADARALLKALKYIVSQIDDKINLGEQSRQEYIRELDKHAGAEHS